jgi:hypothetical protein
MDVFGEFHDESPATTGDRAPRWQPNPGVYVAVIAGEGLGWMAQILAVQIEQPERLYCVRLADGRRLLKYACELAELVGIGDAGWPDYRRREH